MSSRTRDKAAARERVAAMRAEQARAARRRRVLLAPDYYRGLHRPYWTDLLADQHLGGGIGWAMGELPILLVPIALLAGAWALQSKGHGVPAKVLLAILAAPFVLYLLFVGMMVVLQPSFR